jgi:Xaa-Pro aminopeptidase
VNPFEKRRKNLVAKLDVLEADAFLVTDIKNVRYLTGFTGSAAYLLVSGESQVLLSDCRYEVQLADECANLPVDIRDVSATLIDSSKRLSKSWGLRRLAIEAHRLTKVEFDQLQSELSAVELVETQGVVEDLRAIKDSVEIAAIRRSVAVNQTAFQNAVAAATAEQTEREFAYRLEHEMRLLGASGLAFDAIVGVGPRAALPHGRPTDVQLGSSDNFLVDWGANVDGYLSDLTRMVITREPSEKLVEIYAIVLEAQLAAIDAVGPGAKTNEVDGAARRVIEDAGFGEFFGHGCGHSFGLQIHESPFLSPSTAIELQAGMVLTIEPGIYLPGIAGVRLEDDLLVTENGCELLSNLPKDREQCLVRLGDG